MYASIDHLSTNKLENLAERRYRKAADRLEAAIENLSRVAGQTAPPSRPSATVLPFRLRRGEPVVLAMAGPLLERVSDISLADVLAERRRMMDDPSIPRYKYMAEEDLSPVERRDLERQRREWRAECEAVEREWKESFPIGCGIDGFDYAPQWKVLRIYLPPRHKPDMRRTIAFATKDWPRVARIVCVSGDEACVTYVRRAGEWAALRPGDPGYAY